MKGIEPYSKHKVEVIEWGPKLDKKPDIVYLHYGAFINSYIDMMKEHREIRWIAGVMGPACFGRMGRNEVEYLDGVMVLDRTYASYAREKFPNTPIYFADVGVDTKMFSRQPTPKYFSVGMAENLTFTYDCIPLAQFLNLPYPKKMSVEGLGSFRDFSKMPLFYKDISVLVDVRTWACPGGMMYLEAGATGRPVVCMESGTTAEWLPKEWLAKDINHMAELLILLHDDKEVYDKASEQFYQIGKSRDFSVVATEYDRMFEGTMNNVRTSNR
jgi:hypothetical protein